MQRRQRHVERERAAPCGRSRTTARRWRGRACAAPRRRADGAASRPHRRRCPSRCRPARCSCVDARLSRRCVTVVSSRSPMTLSVTVPAVRAVTATVMVSPGAYSGLSSAISSRSGVSALASAYQPASKRDRGHRPVAIAGRDFEAVAAPLHRQRDARRLVGGDVERAVGDARGRLDRLVVPAAVAPVPLIAGSRP